MGNFVNTVFIVIALTSFVASKTSLSFCLSCCSPLHLPLTYCYILTSRSRHRNHTLQTSYKINAHGNFFSFILFDFEGQVVLYDNYIWIMLL